MKTFVVTVALMLAIAAPAVAQLQSGNITGVVRDQQGGVLPGATVTVQGVDLTQTFVTDGAGQFRFLNLPPGRYTVTVELTGFRRVVREDILVTVGQNVDLPFTLGVAAIEETITVSGESPIVDTKQMGTATNFTQDELAKIPNSRDPWALLRTVPGVVLDRVNIAGNETGQQSGFVSKGTRREDAVWTMDGVIITDMAAVGASPTYFDYDVFEEIHISTAGQDIRQPTGGVGLNLVVKRGTNQLKGSARGYFTGDGLEGSNLSDELRARGLTSDTVDHNDQITDYGFDAGGPILRNKAWFYFGWTEQDIRLVRQAGGVIDKTVLKTTNFKANYQATQKDMVSFLWFLGDKIKEGRATGNAQFEPDSARWNQGNAYPDNPFHGLWKLHDDRVFSSNLFLSVKYAYYGTGFSLSPRGGLDQQAGISPRLGSTFGSTVEFLFNRPVTMFAADGSYFANAMGSTHEIKYGGGWRRADSFAKTLWPGDMAVAFDNSVTDQRARLYREGAGTDRAEYAHLYVGDTVSRGRMTLDLGVRYDRQYGSALASATQSNKAFPNLVPGIAFSGYEAPFTWNNVSPRVGLTYALDESRKTLLRASFARFSGQLNTGTVGFSNPSGAAGWVEYPWRDLNGDNLVQVGEIDLSRILTFGGGFNPAAPTAVTSANRIDPDLKAPVTSSLVIGVDRELVPNLAVQANYTFGRTTDWGAAAFFTPWVGLTAADYAPGAPVTGALHDGTPFSVPTFIPDAAKIAANGNSRIMTNYPGYSTQYQGVEASLIKRLAGKWMARASFSYNNATESYDANPPIDGLGNPARLDTYPLVDGGQFAPRSAGSGQGDLFINAKWQLNINGVYQLPYAMEVAGNLFGRQGNPFPVFRIAAMGRDGAQRVLVSPELDTFRFDDTWNLDLRWAKLFTAQRFSARVEVDMFNVLNSNVELQRERNLASPAYRRLNQNLSPRILRLGLRLTFG